MNWTHSERASLLSWGEAGRPGSGAVLIQAPAQGAQALAGLLFSQADFVSLPLVRSFNFPASAALVQGGRPALMSIALGIALNNGLDRVVIEGAAQNLVQPMSALDLANDFEAWKAGTLTAPGAVVAQVVRNEIPNEVVRVGTALGVLNSRNNAVYPTARTPKPSQPLDGFRVAAAIRDLTSGKFATSPFVVHASGICEGLDIEAARRALASIAAPTNRAVSWYGNKSHASHADRLQAASVVPVLAGIIAETASIANAVDRRMSIQPLLTDRTGLSKGALKRLSKVTTPLPAGVIFENHATGRDALDVERVRRLSLKGRLTEDRACRILAELPPEWTPQTNEAWTAFYDVVSGAAVPLEEIAGIPVKTSLAASKGDWEAFRATLARAADMDPETFSRREIALTTSDAIEVVNELACHVVIPTALVSIVSTQQPEGTPLDNDLANARDAAFQLVAGGAKSPITALFETARRWMSRIPALQNMVAAPGDLPVPAEGAAPRFVAPGVPEGGFPQFCADFHAANGLVVRSLNHPVLLTQESARLGHCVGRNYQSKALQGNCWILSVQDERGDTSHSTIEIAPPQPGQLRLVETQHRGRDNHRPSAEALAAAAEFYQAVQEGRHGINLEQALAWRTEHQNMLAQIDNRGQGAPIARMASWRGALGLDPHDRALRAGLWQEWRFILGGDIARADSPEALYRFPVMRDLVDKLSPAAAKILKDRQQAANVLAAPAPELVPEP